jgi:hypothetical protein
MKWDRTYSEEHPFEGVVSALAGKNFELVVCKRCVIPLVAGGNPSLVSEKFCFTAVGLHDGDGAPSGRPSSDSNPTLW